jgi:hypothetical protein
MAKVLVDWHHGALYYSFHLLFERRLGWELYRPIGYDWYRKRYWRYSSNPWIVKQYLEVPNASTESGVRVYLETSEEDGVYLVRVYEGTELYVQRGITFKKFLETDFDYIVASVYNHEQPYYELVKKYKPEAKLIRQFGNPYEACDFNICRNILNSTKNPVPPDVNTVFYHPEFSLKDYYYAPPKEHNVIKNFMNCYPQSVDAVLWSEYRRDMPDFVWRMHGILGEDGLLRTDEVPKAMRDSSFIWHLKHVGDGYGFVVHHSYACGRPLIVKRSYYNGKTAEALFEDSVTCIDLDLGSKSENIEKIRYFSEPSRHLEMCQNAYKKFKETVDFDAEFMKIKDFLQRCR